MMVMHASGDETDHLSDANFQVGDYTGFQHDDDDDRSVEVSELLSFRTLASVQCDQCFIQEVNEALQHWTLPL